MSTAIAPLLGSMACQYRHFQEEWYVRWAKRLGFVPGVSLDRPYSYRKIWEWCAILQALSERGMLQPGKSSIGFAVGNEPLSSVFAAYGVDVLATDLAADSSHDRWTTTGQHAASLDGLHHPLLVDGETFRQKVSFTPTDMTDLSALPSASYDFAWSSCAMEHLGSLDRGLTFAKDAMRLLKPGGVAIHTTEFNCGSNDDTLESGLDVIYRRRDIEGFAGELRRADCELESPSFEIGTHRFDIEHDVPPFMQSGRAHIKLLLDNRFVATSYALIVKKAA